MAVKDWSTTAASNTTVGGVSIAENCPPANLNNAIRAVMAAIATHEEGVVNVKEHAATGDGVADDTAEIQAAVTAAGAKTYGGVVYFPPGNYLITDTIAVPAGVALIGPGICDLDNPGNLGATIYVDGTLTATPAFTLDDGCSFVGINFYYPDQVTSSPPTAYDYAIELDLSSESIQGVDIEDVVIHNAYNGINLGGASGGYVPGNTHISNVRAYCINTGIHVGYTLVNLFCSQCTFSPEFWPASLGQDVREWSIDNGEGIHYSAGTGMFISDLACFGLNTGILVDGDGTNGLTFLKVSNSVIDGCRRSVVASGDGAIQGGTFTGCTFSPRNGLDDTDDGCIGIYFSENALINKIQFSGCYFGAANGNHVQLVETTTGIQAWAIFDGCSFEQANSDDNAGTHYNIFTNDDLLTLTVSNCFFRNNTTDVFCIKATSIRDIVVTGNIFYGSHDTAIDLTAVARNATVTGNQVVSSTTASIVMGTISGEYRLEDNIWDTVPLRALASASSMALTEYHHYYTVTGTTDINTITGGYPDRTVTLKFTDAAPGDLKNGTGNVQIRSGDLSPVQNDTISLIYDGTNWQVVGTTV